MAVGGKTSGAEQSRSGGSIEMPSDEHAGREEGGAGGVE
jgi:hypothetical protein